jgi:hypothetical protein
MGKKSDNGGNDNVIPFPKKGKRITRIPPLEPTRVLVQLRRPGSKATPPQAAETDKSIQTTTSPQVEVLTMVPSSPREAYQHSQGILFSYITNLSTRIHKLMRIQQKVEAKVLDEDTLDKMSGEALVELFGMLDEAITNGVDNVNKFIKLSSQQEFLRRLVENLDKSSQPKQNSLPLNSEDKSMLEAALKNRMQQLIKEGQHGGKVPPGSGQSVGPQSM